jgi:hypothetical protein
VVLGMLVACAAPLAVLAVWFGLIDTTGFGEGRCAACGVEGYVIAAHIAAAVCLALVVAALSTVRRVAAGKAGLGPVTISTLALLGGFIGVSLLWHDLFAVPAAVALVASFVLYPVAFVWWVWLLITWWAGPPKRLGRSLTSAVALAWTSLLVLLPGTFAFVWLDRVNWIEF